MLNGMVMKSAVIRLFKEPLLHFLALGFGLFLIYDVMSPDDLEQDPNRIVVDRNSLLTFMQHRSRVFETERFNKIFDKLSEQELQSIIDDYVREEALYREAKALNLDKNDYTARRRLVQQFEYITRGFVATVSDMSEKELQTYFDKNLENYKVAPEITFTHIYFSDEKHGKEKAEELARAKLKELNKTNAPFHSAVFHGDRFLYNTNYVNREADEIASHFGEDMQHKVFDLAVSDSTWYGPFHSAYGSHLVMVTKLSEAYTPKLEEIRERVVQDALRERVDQEMEASISAIVDTYTVEINRTEFAARPSGSDSATVEGSL